MLNLFCFPYAGGGAHAYREFEKYVMPAIRITGIDLPGHGRLITKPLLTDVYAMTDYIWDHLKEDLNSPYALYGHSMGATLAYLLTRKIFRQGAPRPRHLLVSGRPGPSGGSREEKIHHLPRQEFISKVTEYGGTPKEVLAEQELMDFVEPILRADFQAVEGYHFAGDTPLDIPITVMLGLDDKTCRGEVIKWREVTTRDVTLRGFPGGHFFIFDCLPEIGEVISRALMK